MKKYNTLLACLIAAIAFGTAWAIRGKFGHEQGAAWAGGIGAIALILVAKRADWYNRIFKIALAAAFGWGLGGMISYGVVVGYGRADEFVNVYYGLLMLFVIGSLYGFLGGGLFGLSLTDTKESKINWSILIAEMVAFALLSYGLLINQLEWLMTPPRSELWAACFGACIPVAWHALRNKNKSVIKVAVWSALGAGFGFAFGNFLQVLGLSGKSIFNFWNIMEYSIGFFGGLGMSYATLTSSWPTLEKESPRSNFVPAFLLVVLIPLVVWDQSFVTDKFKFIFDLGGNAGTVMLFQWIAVLTIVVVAVIVLTRCIKDVYSYADIRNLFVLYLGSYTLLSFLLTGILIHPIEQYLYLVNMAIILFAASRFQGEYQLKTERPVIWITTALSLMAIIALLALVALEFNPKPLNVGRF